MVYLGLSFYSNTSQVLNLIHLSFGHILGISLTKETIRFLKIIMRLIWHLGIEGDWKPAKGCYRINFLIQDDHLFG